MPWYAVSAGPASGPLDASANPTQSSAETLSSAPEVCMPLATRAIISLLAGLGAGLLGFWSVWESLEMLGHTPGIGWDDVIHCIDPANERSKRAAERLGSAYRRMDMLPAPFAEVTVEIWGQTREEWRAAQPRPVGLLARWRKRSDSG